MQVMHQCAKKIYKYVLWFSMQNGRHVGSYHRQHDGHWIHKPSNSVLINYNWIINHVVFNRFHNSSTFWGRGTDALIRLLMTSQRFLISDKSRERDGQRSTQWTRKARVVMCAVCGRTLSCSKMAVYIYIYTLMVQQQDGAKHFMHIARCTGTPYANGTHTIIPSRGTMCLSRMVAGSGQRSRVLHSLNRQSSAPIQKRYSSLKTTLFHSWYHVARVRRQANISRRWTGVRGSLHKKTARLGLASYLPQPNSVQQSVEILKRTNTPVHLLGFRLLKTVGLLLRDVEYGGQCVPRFVRVLLYLYDDSRSFSQPLPPNLPYVTASRCVIPCNTV